MEEVFRFKIWFLNALGLIHGGAYYWNFMVLIKLGMNKSIYIQAQSTAVLSWATRSLLHCLGVQVG